MISALAAIGALSCIAYFAFEIRKMRGERDRIMEAMEEMERSTQLPRIDESDAELLRRVKGECAADLIAYLHTTSDESRMTILSEIEENLGASFSPNIRSFFTAYADAWRERIRKPADEVM